MQLMRVIFEFSHSFVFICVDIYGSIFSLIEIYHFQGQCIR